MERSPWEPVELLAPQAHLLGHGEARGTITFNGEPLDDAGLAVLHDVERQLRFDLDHGDYWYDPRSGAVGRIGGPTAGFLPARLRLGGPLRRGCSGGGTGVQVNGRELHTLDVRALERVLGALAPGDYRLYPGGLLVRADGSAHWELGGRARTSAA